MKTIKDLLSMDILKDAIVIAGENGLNRMVESVETLDTPDMTNFMTNNSLLLTSGFSFKDNPEGLYDLVNSLTQSSCSGLGIKVARFVHKIPDKVIELANSLNFPIIHLPNTITLTEVNHHLLHYLWENELDDLFSAIRVQKNFTNMMLKGATPKSLIDHLSHLINRPTLLFNPFGYLINTSNHFRATQMNNIQQKIETFFLKNASLKAREELPETHSFRSDNKTFEITIFSVQTSQPYPHALVILNGDKLETSYLIIEQASNVISSTLVKNEAIKENDRVIKNNFFSSLVDGNIQSQEEMIHRGKHYGLEVDQKYICIASKVDDDKQSTLFEVEERINRFSYFIYEYLDNLLSKKNVDKVIFMKNKFFIVILQFPKMFNEKLKQSIFEFLRSFQEQMADVYNTSISFGISDFVNEISELTIAYREAVDALITGTSLNKKQVINFYKTKELTELLRMIPEDNIRNFYEETMRSLAYAQSNEENDLINTLKVYLDQNCEITETSKKLFIHRNTVKYRIAKCEKILQYNIHDPEHSLRLRIALLVRNFFIKG